MPDTRENLSLAGSEACEDIGFTYSELLHELAAEIAVVRPPDSVTVKELADQSGKTYDVSRRFLENKLKAGELVRVKLLLEGGPTWVYYRD